MSALHLKKMPKLKFLGLVDTKVTDTGMETLASLKLSQLALDGCNVTDKGLESLQSLKSLTKLSVQRTKVSRKGITAFRKALPKCEVVSDLTPAKKK